MRSHGCLRKVLDNLRRRQERIQWVLTEVKVKLFEFLNEFEEDEGERFVSEQGAGFKLKSGILD